MLLKQLSKSASFRLLATTVCKRIDAEALAPRRYAEEWLPVTVAPHYGFGLESSLADECSVNIKGMASIGMRIDEKIDWKEIRIKSTKKSPFRFDLNCFLEGEGDTCNCYMVFESDLNPMLQMMVEKPLGSLFNHIVRSLKKRYENG